MCRLKDVDILKLHRVAVYTVRQVGNRKRGKGSKG